MTACTGFIGLGQMGLPMLARLARAGHALVAFDADPTARRRAAELAAAGTAVRLSDTVAGLADCDIVILMLPDSPAVETVVLGTGTQTGLADLLASTPPASWHAARHCWSLARSVSTPARWST